MKTCKSCRKEIDSKAVKCPHCRADQRNWFGRHKVLTGILVIIVVFMVMGAAGGSKSSTSTTSKTETATAKTDVKPIEMEATELVSEYDKNKLAAQDKYTGKVVQTTAFIQNISSDIAGSYFLSLKPNNDQYYVGTTIQCYFADKSSLTSLSNGESVTVKGTMQDMSLGIVEMKECSIVK